MSASNICKTPLPDDDPATKDKGAVSPRVTVVTRRQSKSKTTQYSSTPTLSVSSSTSGNYSVGKSTDSDPTFSPTTRNLRSRLPTESSITDYEDRAYASQATSPQGAEDSEDTQSEKTNRMEGRKRDTSISMSASNIDNIPLPDNDPAPKDKGIASARVGVGTRQPAKPRTPAHYSSTPTLSVSSSPSGSYSVSRSTGSNPTASPTTRNLRSRRPKASSASDNYEDRASASQATCSQDAEDSDDTQSELTPPMEGGPAEEGGPVVIPVAENADEELVGPGEGDCIFMFMCSVGLVFIGLFIFSLAHHFYWSNKDSARSRLPMALVSNTTEVIYTDADIDMD